MAIPLFATSAFANTSIPTAQNEHAQPISLVTGSATRDHACEAFLCFAGGLHEPACQSTIRKVTRDLARGKSFPVCRQVANSDGSVGGQNGSPKIWTQSTKRRVYVYVQDTDGATRQVANIRKR